MLDVIVPVDAWEGDELGAVTVWMYRDGQNVGKGNLLAELMVEKATVEIFAPSSGILHIRIPVESAVRKGDALASIE